jgi:hypothetical protein
VRTPSDHSSLRLSLTRRDSKSQPWHYMSVLTGHVPASVQILTDAGSADFATAVYRQFTSGTAPSWFRAMPTHVQSFVVLDYLPNWLNEPMAIDMLALASPTPAARPTGTTPTGTAGPTSTTGRITISTSTPPARDKTSSKKRRSCRGHPRTFGDSSRRNRLCYLVRSISAEKTSKELGKRFASTRPRAGCEAMVGDHFQYSCFAAGTAASEQLLATNDSDGVACAQFDCAAAYAVRGRFGTGEQPGNESERS